MRAERNETSGRGKLIAHFWILSYFYIFCHRDIYVIWCKLINGTVRNSYLLCRLKLFAKICCFWSGLGRLLPCEFKHRPLENYLMASDGEKSLYIQSLHIYDCVLCFDVKFSDFEKKNASHHCKQIYEAKHPAIIVMEPRFEASQP